MTNHDITAEEVARRWLGGESYLSIASDLGVSESIIKRRIKVAKATMPDLPWENRKRTRKSGPTREFVQMNDGKAGERPVAGSVIRRRRRGR